MAISNPFSMNRDGHHPRILIASNDFNLLEEWWRSLRYSTHVQVHFLTQLSNLEFVAFNLEIHIVNDLRPNIVGQFLARLDIDWVFEDTNRKTFLPNGHVKVDFGHQQNEIVEYSYNDNVGMIKLFQRGDQFAGVDMPVIYGPMLFADALRNLRLRGFNIPLSVVQALMGRKQVFPTFINENVVVAGNLKFRGKSIYFDLDETLVMFEKPVELTIDFLNDCYVKGYSCYLITRHIYDISNTLKSIGVDKDYFKRIYKVNMKEKKGEVLLSLGCTKDDLFIDNEFPERLEVRKRTGCNVIDVNQIEFVELA